MPCEASQDCFVRAKGICKASQTCFTRAKGICKAVAGEQPASGQKLALSGNYNTPCHTVYAAGHVITVGCPLSHSPYTAEPEPDMLA
ncbi:MAG: hypothetical protein JWP58_1736 [Hymenobacter sp.]|nr:hypothetical protein [Hymenobacter sp.]